MKRALVLSLVVVLGLGVGAFAQLSGAWESTLSFNMGAVAFPDFIVDLTSTFEIDYTLAGWTFGSASEFDLTGFAAQSFSVEGQLGAFTFESSAAFAPMVVTVFTYPAPGSNLTQTPSTAVLCDRIVVATTYAPMFLTLDATASVSIAGVTASAYVYMDQSNITVQNVGYAFTLAGVQTDSWVLPSYNNGTGARITIAGSIGGMDVTSYTYFNLVESNTKSTYCPKIGKAGVFSIATAGCDVVFTEEYVMFQGLTFGCVEIDAALQIFCTGFGSLKLVANGIDIGGWATLNVGIIFTTTSKDLDLCLTLNKLSFSCITVEVGVNSNGYAESTGGTLTLENIQIHGFGLTTEVGAVTFTFATELDAYSTQFSTATAWKYLYGDAQKAFLVPFAGISDLVAGTDPYCYNGSIIPGTDTTFQFVMSDAGYYELVCVALDRYKLWEMFKISIDEDACCGGLFGVDVVTYFGDKQTLSYFAYNVVDAGTNAASTATYLLGTSGWTAQTANTGDPLCYDSVAWGSGYADVASAVQLFNWAYTTVAFSVGMGSNLTLNIGAGISAFGWETLDLGFEFTW
jgi:hypothetical protein